MNDFPSYRLGARTVTDVSEFLSGFRSDALRVLARQFGRAVADESARRIDLHRTGLDSKDASASPLKDAVVSVRKTFDDTYESPDPAVEFDCEIRFHFVNGVVLASFLYGIEAYQRLFESRKGVTPCGWSPESTRPKSVSAAEWEKRGALWREVEQAQRLGNGVTFKLVDDTIPAPKWSAVKRLIPPAEARIRRTARALAWFERHPFRHDFM